MTTHAIAQSLAHARDAHLTPRHSSHLRRARESLRMRVTIGRGANAFETPRTTHARTRASERTTTAMTSSQSQSPPSAHVLTAYAVRGSSGTLPALRVVPLELSDDAGKACVRALWSAVRLLRETNTDRGGKSMTPFSNEGACELFAQAGVRDEGDVLRYGVARTNAKALAEKALGRGSTREVKEGAAFDLVPRSNDFESRVAYGEILREALYEHTLSVAGELFDVSRLGRSGVLLTAKLTRGSWAWTPVSDAVAVLDQYTIDIEIGAEDSAQILCTLGHELRSPLSVRQILDDPSLMDLPEGAEVVALGGPHLQGQLSYTNIGGKTIGEAREELKGESLLSYHRARYPARIELLANARDDDDAVQLVQPGRPPSAYPAELLSPVIKMNILDATTREAVSETCSGTPADLQRRISAVRSMLGQPFTPLLQVDEKMQRLAAAPPPASANDDVRRGSMKTGPAVMPSASTMTTMEKALPTLTLLLGASTKTDETAATNYISRLTADVEAAMIGWSAREEDIDAIKGDIANAVVCYYDDSSLNATRSAFIKVFRENMSSSYLVALSETKQFVEAGARQAGSRVSNESTVRWAADDSDARRLCFSLIARRGGQATVCKDRIIAEDAHIVGAGVKSGLPVVDSYGRVIARQFGAPSGATVTGAVRTAIDLRLKMIAIHHAGESDVEDVRAAMNLAHENNVTISTIVDVVDADFGRVLGWSKQAGAVTQPDRGFWSPLGTVGDDAVVVTTGMESNLVRGVSRPLRLRIRAGDDGIESAVDQILKLSVIDCHFTPSTSSFRLPLTLRPKSENNLEIILVAAATSTL